ncbi:arylamine N-acetyltransferase family protein [Gordonia rubripertincta]|uniref:Arylamine N-acetyltransferase n=1 Tax=Gordonia rubripertincta TaxID=36822 RepID=A0ABT4MS04_GORRU|nr:arylamine N-acetyltransferase [Gordonia rubripertincta]MCZ4549792.1 arylamine N-acetyltransferase [Gordonia rubripertincta]
MSSTDMSDPALSTTSSTIDLDAYFKRVGHTGSATPTLETLQALVAAHTRAIPFETIDPLMGVPVMDLGASALFEKLVSRGRGGYCYEQNGLMRYVLAELGFTVEAFAGRVVWMMPADAPTPARTHQVLSVTVVDTGLEYLVDVGFGGQTLSSPIRMILDEKQSTRHEPYRIVRHGDESMLEALVRDAWRPLYTFAPTPVPQIDLEVGSWYVSTHPASGFVGGMTVARVTDDARWNLRGRNLSVHGRDGTSTKTVLQSSAEVVELLDHRFGINLAGIDGLEQRVAQVLDT